MRMRPFHIIKIKIVLKLCHNSKYLNSNYFKLNLLLFIYYLLGVKFYLTISNAKIQFTTGAF